MPKGYPHTACRNCGKPVAARIELSRTGLCINCGPLIQAEATMQLVEHNGPWFDHWRARCLAAFGINLTDQTNTERVGAN